MGFVTDGSNAQTEKLYLAMNDDSHMLGTLDIAQSPPRWKAVGTLAIKSENSPELTGTGEGKLFAYVAQPAPGFVQEIDRTTGKLLGTRRDLAAASGENQGWAFALYAGVFYIFATIDGDSAIHSIRRKTGEYALVRDKLPWRIVGAGVSTCAPQLERD
jgi:hypothetical protein